MFFGYLEPLHYIVLMMTRFDFWGDLTDIEAKTKSMLQSHTGIERNSDQKGPRCQPVLCRGDTLPFTDRSLWHYSLLCARQPPRISTLYEGSGVCFGFRIAYSLPPSFHSSRSILHAKRVVDPHCPTLQCKFSAILFSLSLTSRSLCGSAGVFVMACAEFKV